MPTYDYRCSCGHEFEEFQGINSEPVAICPKCGKDASRVIGAGGGLMFKGTGFYITDYKKPASSDNSTKNGGESKEKKSNSKKEST